MVRYFLFAILGAALGIAMVAAGNLQKGIPIAVLGAFAGTLLATKGTSGSRALRLFAAMTFAKNIPIGRVKAFQWVDEHSQPAESDDAGERLFKWLIASHVVNPRRWLVFVGLALGAIAGVIVAVHDYSAVNAGGTGWMLPLQGARDPILTQAAIITVGWIIWGGTVGGFLASAVFRRPLILAVTFAAFVSGCIGYATIDAGQVPDVLIIICYSTAAAFIALFSGICMSLEDRSSEKDPSYDQWHEQ